MSVCLMNVFAVLAVRELLPEVSLRMFLPVSQLVLRSFLFRAPSFYSANFLFVFRSG